MKTNKVSILIMLCLFLSHHSVFAEDKITWRKCVQVAKENNPDLISATEQINQARADRNIDLSAMLPQIDAQATGTRSKSANRNRTDTYSYGITGRQLLFDGFKTASEITGDLKAIESKEYNYAVSSSNVRLDLRSSFAALMRAQNLVLITKEIADRRKQNLELVRLRYESGRENKGSLLAAEADVAQAEFEIAQAQRSVTLSQRELSNALGFASVNLWEAEGEFILQDNYSIKPDLELLTELVPFLRDLIAKKEAARYNVNSKEADFLPKVYLNGSLGKTDDSWVPRNEEWSAGFSVTLPLLEGGSRIAEVWKARSQLEQARAAERSGRDSVLVTLEQSWKDLQDAIANVSVQNKFLDAALERAKITRQQYAIGLASFNDWIIIEDNLVSARKSYLNAQADMLVAEAYWIQAIGGTLNYDET